MRPRPKKIGDKVTIICPECDGSKINSEGKKCEMCDENGKVQGVVSRQ